MEGKLYIQAQDTKTNTPRVLFLTGDLYRVLHTWKSRCALKWLACPWICHRGGIRLQSLKHSWRKACQTVGVGQMVKDATKGRKVWHGKIPHDFRRTAVRNMVRAGVPEKVAMAISGHKTRSVFDRYNTSTRKTWNRLRCPCRPTSSSKRLQSRLQWQNCEGRAGVL